MLIKVRQGQNSQNYYYKTFDVDTVGDDNARKAAFRYVYRRVEKDYQELHECTSRDAVIQKLSASEVDMLLRFNG